MRSASSKCPCTVPTYTPNSMKIMLDITLEKNGRTYPGMTKMLGGTLMRFPNFSGDFCPKKVLGKDNGEKNATHKMTEKRCTV